MGNIMAPKVWLAQSKYDADYCVYFVNNRYEEKNAEIIAGGKLVSSKYSADVKVCIVNNKYDAKILIMRQNFPK